MPLRLKIILRAALLLTILFLNPTLCAEALDAPVRVGYYEDGDYMYRNAQREYEGYNFEFLFELSKLSGLRYEVVNTNSWQNAMQLLIDGEIDLLPAVYRTEERMKTMLFADQPMCNIYTTLNVREDDTRYDYEDFDAFQGMRIGIIRDSEDGENFKEYCAEHEVTVDLVDYDETDQLLTALADGTLDGIAITHLGRNSTFRSVAQFSPNPLYIAVSQQRPDLLAQINRASNDVLLRNPGYLMDLYDKYLSTSVNQKPAFTKEEMEYIHSAAPIRVSYDPAFAPLTYSSTTGHFSGAVADLFNIIMTDSGMTFQYEGHPPSVALERMEQGDIDVICTVDSNYLWDERHNMSTTLYYVRTPCVLVTNREFLTVQTLALPEGYQLSEWVAKNHQNKKILYVPSVEACFDAVRKGEAQATYVNTYVANYLLANPEYENLTATTLTQYSSDLCIGISKSADPRLFSILDKYIQYMAKERVDELLLKNSILPQEVSVEAFVRQHTWLVTALLSSIILLLCIYLRNVSRSKRRIQNLLYRDDLTGLDNLNRFYLRSATLLQNPAEPYALIYCDIDRFKLINDNFGFEEGDHVLHACGQAIQQIIADDECCARISADNFVLLMKCGDWATFTARLEQLPQKLNVWRKTNGLILHEISLSFGTYRVAQGEQTDIHRMMDLANYARRNAKNNTGDAVIVYDEKMRQKALLEQELEGRLAVALEQREFVAYYQPKVNMDTGELIGSEALVRWNHPEHGLLMPGSFIPFFERKGTIVQIDLYLYETVCRSIRGWLDQGLAVAPVSCNFSQLHFGRPGFVERVTAIADQWNVPHPLLELEITESTIASVPEEVNSTLMALKKQEFLITIDDFGSGYSSLGQLQQLQADVLKLDRSFVINGLRGKREQIVIENLVNMVNALEMTVICEGVETEVQAQELQKLGCHFAQGYYYYRPMPVTAFEQLIRTFGVSPH